MLDVPFEAESNERCFLEHWLVKLAELRCHQPTYSRTEMNRDSSARVNRHQLSKVGYEVYRSRLKEVFDVDGYWVPLNSNLVRSRTIHFQTEVLRIVDNKALRELLLLRTGDRCVELSEDGKGFEIDVTELDIKGYSGLELFFCDRSVSWLIYCSHEGTVTFAGEVLIAFMRERFADRQELIDPWFTTS